MAKTKPDLAVALDLQEEEGTSTVTKTKPASKRAKPKQSNVVANEQPKALNGSREGLVNIAGWFPLSVKFELDEIRIKRGRELGRRVTFQEIQNEMMNDFFRKHGRPELAKAAG